MKLVLSAERYSLKPRLPCKLIRVVPSALAAWIWCEELREGAPQQDLFCFNVEPEHGGVAVNLGRLDPTKRFSGLALLLVPADTFEVNLAGFVARTSAYVLPVGRTLLEVLKSASAAPVVDEDLLWELSGLASERPEELGALASLEAFLESITVTTAATTKDPPQPARRALFKDRLAEVRRMSVWTPGATERSFLDFYTPLVGPTEAARLWSVNRAAVGAVAAGEFERQVDLGRELAGIVPDSSVLAGEAAYFTAEGLRLLADIEADPARQTSLRAEAVEHYERASELLRDDPRPLRGLGRIMELRGDFDGALKYFTVARGLCYTEMNRPSLVPMLDLAHEVLRTTRHFIHCLLDIRANSSTTPWHRQGKERELELHLQQCENLHQEYMPLFKEAPEWFFIEWFMGFVFLAKAWGVLGRPLKMQASLTHALEARRATIGEAGTLSKVQRANLRWWLSVAKGHGEGLDRDFLERAERLEEALEGEGVAAVAAAIEEILGSFAAPWGPSSLGA